MVEAGEFAFSIQSPDGHVGAQVVDPAPGQHSQEWRGLSIAAVAQSMCGQGGRSGHPREPQRGSGKSCRSPVHPRGGTAKSDEFCHVLGRQVTSGRVPQLPDSPRKGWGPGRGAPASSHGDGLCSARRQPELGQGERQRTRAGCAVLRRGLAGVTIRQTWQRGQELRDFIYK